jgi:hypothetical protein
MTRISIILIDPFSEENLKPNFDLREDFWFTKIVKQIWDGEATGADPKLLSDVAGYGNEAVWNLHSLITISLAIFKISSLWMWLENWFGGGWEIGDEGREVWDVEIELDSSRWF